MDLYLSIIVIVFFLALFGYILYNAKKRKDKKDQDVAESKPYIDITGEFDLHLSPQGAKVYFPKGMEAPAKVLDIIDDGLATQISKMPEPWVNARKESDYTIFFLKPMATNKETTPGSPALLVNYKDAEGKWQTIQTAGTCNALGQGLGAGEAICVPHQADSNWQYEEYLKNTIWYEAEHWAEFYNEYNTFLRYATVGDVHPHRP